MDSIRFPILSKIDSPTDLKKLSRDKLPELASEIRTFLIESVQKTGGHLASNLGAVEATLALHYVFSSPDDKIIWDVGHQCYTHKLITGRKDEFDNLRAPGGLSGFTKISESEHDLFGSGHSSTSLSAALGYAYAGRLAGKNNFSIAFIGDGAFTGGMVSEALNNLDPTLPFLIIFNENEMSISKNVGAFARYVSSIRTTQKYYKLKDRTKSFLSTTKAGVKIDNFLRRMKKKLKNKFYGSNYFENIGLRYYGPIDGNDVEKVIFLLENAKKRGKSAVIHLKTLKGKGFAPAEEMPEYYHGISASAPPSETFSSVFGKKMISLAENNDKICAISAAMSQGCGLDPFAKKFPDRFFDVGIAEAHAATFAAGLAASGMKPVFSVYSSFLQRAFDNVIHDIALQKLPVVVTVDRANLAESDGPTHHGIFDVAFLSSVPNIELYAPASFKSLEKILENAATGDKPTFIRYPSGGEKAEALSELHYSENLLLVNFDDGEECDCFILTYGRIFAEAVKAARLLAEKGKKCGVIVLEKLIPYADTAEKVLALLGDKKAPILFLEEGIRNGGAAMNLYDIMRQNPKFSTRKYKISALDDFAFSKKGEPIIRTCALDAESAIYNIYN